MELIKKRKYKTNIGNINEKHTEIGILQINTNRSKTSLDISYSTAKTYKADILLITEPNLIQIKKVTEYTDLELNTAIILINKDNKVGAYGKGNGFCWLELEHQVVYSCYASPNIAMENFEEIINDLGNSIKRQVKPVIVTGDFNAKAPEWGHNMADKRGELVNEWTEELNLNVINDGLHPTFVRGESQSFIDLTLVNTHIVKNISNWQVLDHEESLSDHNFIYFKVENNNNKNKKNTCMIKTQRWNINKMNRETLIKKLKEETQGKNGYNEQELTEIITRSCNEVIPKQTASNRKGVYWWNDDIKEARQAAIRARRVITRFRKKGGSIEEREIKEESYRIAKKNLKDKILKSKKENWKKICEEVERDPWGRGYQIATKKLKIRDPPLTDEKEKEIIQELFPKHKEIKWNEENDNNRIEEFTQEELMEACKQIKNKKSPGPDKINPEIVKVVVEAIPEYVLNTMNKALISGKFPPNWKKARVILLKKPGKLPTEKGAFRPICLINVLGKLLESMIVKRIQLETDGSLSNQQYGFRKGRSTTHAVKRVLAIAERENKRTLKTRNLVLMITIDVKNAFNSVRWKEIVKELKKLNVSKYLTTIIQSYFSERFVITHSGEEIKTTAGVPQGSKLGPTLWNLFYNELLNLPLPDGCTSIAFADDLALVITGRTPDSIEMKAEQALWIITGWMNKKGLEIATHKTEAILLSGRKKCRTLNIQINNTEIEIKKTLKYLGVIMDKNLSFRPHVEHITEKARRTISALDKILPRVAGPSESKRRLYSSVIHSILLYASEIWGTALKKKTIYQKILSVQRKIGIKICRAYRTIPTQTALVLGKITPIDLKIQQINGKATQQDTLNNWQQKWEAETKGSWTKELIQDIRPWLERKHGETNYYLTQALTNHGSFAHYIHRIGKLEHSDCKTCKQEDTAEHAIFKCKKFTEERQKCEKETEEHLNKHNFMTQMLESEKKWKIIEEYINTIIRKKEQEERD